MNIELELRIWEDNWYSGHLKFVRELEKAQVSDSA